MARYSLSFHAITPTATADTTNLVDSTYPFLLQGGNSTQRLNISEIYMGGEAASTSSPTLTDGSATAPGTVAIFGHIATTKPQRSATLHLLALSFNAYGGIVRWVARPGEELSVVGNTASLGEVSLSAFTGGTPGAISGHCVYEVA
jgi:hypothetical protein